MTALIRANQYISDTDTAPLTLNGDLIDAIRPYPAVPGTTIVAYADSREYIVAEGFNSFESRWMEATNSTVVPLPSEG